MKMPKVKVYLNNIENKTLGELYRDITNLTHTHGASAKLSFKEDAGGKYMVISPLDTKEKTDETV
jgi:hypothetical protein